MKIPLLLLLIVLSILLLNSYLTIPIKSFLYALSLSVKEVLLCFLPFMIFCFIVNSVIKLQSNAIKLFALMAIMICISNFTSTWFAYAISILFKGHINGVAVKGIVSDIDALHPSWQFSLPQLMNNDVSILAALIIGSLIAFFIPKMGEKISTILVKVIDIILHKVLLPIIPVFITGFLVKLAHDEVLLPIITNYLFIFLIILGSSISYIMVWHFIILRGMGALILLKGLLPPVVTGFSTMSSMIALPLLIMAVEKFVKDKKILHSIIAPITNFHLVGDCFAIPILALTISTTFGNPPLDMYQYFMFSMYFIISKFAVAAVPGGGILVMLPVLKSTMGFDDAMLSLITTLYIMFDSMITPINIFGNSVFSILLSKTYNKLFTVK